MSRPVDPLMNRAEEEAEAPAAAPCAPAPPGVRRCEATLPSGDPCPAPADVRVHWPGDDPPSVACRDCALRLQQVAESHRTHLRVVPIGPR